MVHKKNFCVIDTETTGLLREPKAEAIEVACLALNGTDFSEIGRYESLIQPQNIVLNEPVPTWSQRAFEVNKIKIEDLAKAPMAEEVCGKLIGMFGQLKKPILVGHNVIGFDIPILQRLFSSCGYDLNSYIFSPTIDTYTLSYVLWQGDASMPNVKLGTVAQKMSVEMPNSHRAMADVEANAEVFRKLMCGFANLGNSVANGVVKQPVKENNRKPMSNSKYKCPECGQDLVVRVAKKGRNAGGEFYGCTGFRSGCRFSCNKNEITKYKK